MDVSDWARVNVPVESVPYLASVIPEVRLQVLREKCQEALARRAANVLEVGVYRGGSLVILANCVRELAPDHRVIGIDTFSGHPYSDGHPIHPAGKYADVEKERLHAQIRKRGLEPWVELHQGLVEECSHLIHGPFAFAHIDCDLYRPIAACCTAVPSRMLRSGILYFDDYGHEHCPGATRAVDEHFRREVIHQVAIPEDRTCWSCWIECSDLDGGITE